MNFRQVDGRIRPYGIDGGECCLNSIGQKRRGTERVPALQLNLTMFRKDTTVISLATALQRSEHCEQQVNLS